MYILNPHLDVDAGDLFSIAYSISLQTLYVGCQNTSLQWFNFSKNAVPPARSQGEELSASEFEKVSQELSEVINGKKYQRHRFFDSLPQPEGRPKLAESEAQTPYSEKSQTILQHEGVLQIEGCSVIDSAHYGYIYSMVILASSKDGSSRRSNDAEAVALATGSGDETVKVRAPFRCA